MTRVLTSPEEALQILDEIFPDDRRLRHPESRCPCQDSVGPDRPRQSASSSPFDSDTFGRKALPIASPAFANASRRPSRERSSSETHRPATTDPRRQGAGEAFDFIETFRLRMSIADDLSCIIEAPVRTLGGAVPSLTLACWFVESSVDSPCWTVTSSTSLDSGSNGLLLGVPSTFEGEEQFLQERRALIDAAARDDPRSLALLAGCLPIRR